MPKFNPPKVAGGDVRKVKDGVRDVVTMAKLPKVGVGDACTCQDIHPPKVGVGDALLFQSDV